MNLAGDIFKGEHVVVRALCCAAAVPSARVRAMQLLAAYACREPEHRIVYEALQECGDCDAAVLREHLPGLATRAGFPDVRWADYLDHAAGCECGGRIEELASWLIRLKAPAG